MTDNLDLWNRHADIDPKHTKEITGKGYKGTSPKPQHIIWCLTDMFGPIGKGWGAHVLAEGFEPLGDQVLHWCRIEVWHTDRANTFETYGQTMALMATRNGLKADEDAPKKSFTDALVKAASYLGVASSIFLGRYDDQKYIHGLQQQFKDEEQEQAKPSPDWRKLADDLLAAVSGKAATPLTNVLSDGRFQRDFDALAQGDRPKGLEVRKAILDAWNKAHGGQGGPEHPFVDRLADMVTKQEVA